MLIVDSQIHIWKDSKMSAHHRQIPTYSKEDALKEMAEAGVDAAVLHPPSTLGEAMNTLAVEAVKAHPDKFCILGNFDLTAPNRLDIVKNWRQRPGMLGFRFTFNQPHQQAWWTDGSLDWFWAACEQEKLPVGLLAGGHMAALGAIAERHPGLKLVAAHGGGFLPSYLPRSDHGYEVRPEAQTIPHPPSHYLRRIWVDALVYQPENVAHLIRTLGASQVVLGTDYPFDMGEERPIEVLDKVADLSAEDRQRIARGNALGLLGMAQ